MTHVSNDTALKADQVYAQVNNFSYGLDEEGVGTLFGDFSAVIGKEDKLKDGTLNSISMARFSDSGEIYHVAFTGYSAIPGATIDRGNFEELSGEVGNLELSAPIDVDLQNFNKEDSMEKDKMSLFSRFLAIFENKDEKVDETIEQLSADPKLIKAQNDKIALLEQQLDAAKADQRKLEVETLMEKFSNEGKIVDSQKEDVLVMLSSPIGETVQKFLDKNKLVDFSVQTKVAEVKEAQAAPATFELGAGEKQICSNMYR